LAVVTTPIGFMTMADYARDVFALLDALELSDEMRLLLPDFDLSIIHEAGHLSNVEVPWLFNGMLAEYLTRRHVQPG
jgi:hypothetical protein